MLNPWSLYINAVRTVFDGARLAAEAQQVITMRMMLLACGGPRATLETQRMVGEKWLALWLSQMATAASVTRSGRGVMHEAIAPYRRAVRNNHRRLRRRRH